MSEIKPVIVGIDLAEEGNERTVTFYPAAALEALQAENAAQAKRIAELEENRNRLVVSIHSLASNFENVLGVLSKDDEALKKAIGDINHAKKVAAQNRG